MLSIWYHLFRYLTLFTIHSQFSSNLYTFHKITYQQNIRKIQHSLTKRRFFYLLITGHFCTSTEWAELSQAKLSRVEPSGELSRVEPSQVEPSPVKPSQAESSQVQPSPVQPSQAQFIFQLVSINMSFLFVLIDTNYTSYFLYFLM